MTTYPWVSSLSLSKGGWRKAVLELRMFYSALCWARLWESLLRSSGYTERYWQASELCHHNNKGEGKGAWVMPTYLHCGKHKTSSSRPSPVLGCYICSQKKRVEKRSHVTYSWGSKLSVKPLISIQTLPVFQLKGSITNKNNIPWRHIAIVCSYVLWKERYCMAIGGMQHQRPPSFLKTGFALSQCHQLGLVAVEWCIGSWRISFAACVQRMRYICIICT